MPERRADRLVRRLRWVSRLLPGEVRTRVFEPALADLLLDHAEQSAGRGHPAPRLGWSGLVLALESLRIGLPAHLWRAGAPTRMGRAVLALLVMVGTVLVLVRSVAYSAADSGPRGEVRQVR